MIARSHESAFAVDAGLPSSSDERSSASLLCLPRRLIRGSIGRCCASSAPSRSESVAALSSANHPSLHSSSMLEVCCRCCLLTLAHRHLGVQTGRRPLRPSALPSRSQQQLRSLLSPTPQCDRPRRCFSGVDASKESLQSLVAPAVIAGQHRRCSPTDPSLPSVSLLPGFHS